MTDRRKRRVRGSEFFIQQKREKRREEKDGSKNTNDFCGRVCSKKQSNHSREAF